MYRYIIKRILSIIPVLFIVSVMIFTIMYFTPGDPVEILAPTANAEQMEAMRDRLGLNDSYFVQLGRFLRNTFLRFDLGQSYVDHSNVMEQMLLRLPVTFFMTLACCLIQIVVGIPLGISAAKHQNG